MTPILTMEYNMKAIMVAFDLTNVIKNFMNLKNEELTVNLCLNAIGLVSSAFI